MPETETHSEQVGAALTCGAHSGQLAKLSVLFVVLGSVALLCDMAVSAAFLADAGPIWSIVREGFRKLVRPAESFGNGLGVLLILVVLFSADPPGRRYLVRMGAAAYVSGIVANIVKLLVDRTRPRVFFDENLKVLPGHLFDTFAGWLPLTTSGYEGQSFPSGHTAVAVALAIGFCIRWPRARWALIGLAVMTAAQRMVDGHHFLSDCLFGAAIACAMTTICFSVRSPLGKGTKKESPTDGVSIEVVRKAA